MSFVLYYNWDEQRYEQRGAFPHRPNQERRPEGIPDAHRAAPATGQPHRIQDGPQRLRLRGYLSGRFHEGLSKHRELPVRIQTLHVDSHHRAQHVPEFPAEKKVPLFEDHAPEAATIDDFSGGRTIPDIEAESRDLSERLQKEIRKMDVRYRTILTLYHLEEMSYTEIGAIMNLPAGTVKSYLFRARKQLKERLLMQYEREEL